MKKKRRSKTSRKGGCGPNKPVSGGDNKSQGREEVLKNLVEAFASISVAEAAAAYKEAKGDADKAAEILRNSLADDSAADDQSTACSISSGNLASNSSSGSSTVSSSEAFVAPAFAQEGIRNQKGRSRKVVATAGTVSTLLGKDYVRSVPKRSSVKSKGHSEESWTKEHMEEFLCSMFGDDCELSMGVVRDVLCQCGYNVDRALNVLLELSSALGEESRTDHNNAYNKEDAYSSLEVSESVTDRTSDSASLSSESDFLDSVWYTGHLSRTRSKIGGTAAVHLSRQGSLEPELPQRVLESLFTMPTPTSAEREPNTMNWRNIGKQMASLGQRFENCAGDGAAVKCSPAKGDEYQVFREAAKQHWESMKFCYQKAATAFSNGERDYAAYMSEQVYVPGRLHNKRAKEADEKASQDIFKVRNKSMENMITIDLHGQHVKQAMKLLKLHLMFGANVGSVRSFRVITGCGSHGVGKSKLKESVISLLRNEGIRWCEENRGTLLIRLDEQTEFCFPNADSDEE